MTIEIETSSVIKSKDMKFDKVNTQTDKDIRRSINFLTWLIKGRNRHCIFPLKDYPSITADKIEDIYNVKF